MKRRRQRKESMMDAAKSTMGLGVVSMAGMGAMGAIAPLAPGASAIMPIAGAGFTMLNIGRMGKTGMTIADHMRLKKKKFGFKI